MNTIEFERFLHNNSVNLIEGGKTDFNSYVFIPLNRLASSANRLNSTWIRAQYIILNEMRSSEEICIDIEKWKNLSIHSDQFFIVQTTFDEWQIYDYKGNLLGDEGFIKKMIGGKEKITNLEVPLQVIFYGAPGTGKSHKIDNEPHVTSDNTIRITFHPDTDYSTFVGAYKPTMASMPINAFVGTTVHHANNANNEKAYELYTSMFHRHF